MLATAAVLAGQPGLGDVALGLQGAALSLCTVHGSGAFVDFTNVGNEAGETPVYQCGRAFGQSVTVDGCVATIVAHGYVHADHPHDSYLGTMTVDVSFQKTGPATGNLDVTVWGAQGQARGAREGDRSDRRDHLPVRPAGGRPRGEAGPPPYLRRSTG
jgi:hypothetical protein